MFLRCKVRRKDGKQHRYWSVVGNTRTARGRVVQRDVLYLGEINDTQELAWRRSIEVLEDGATQPRTLSLFPEDRCAGVLADASIVHVKLSLLQLRRPRQWGACWLALLLWRELQLDQSWSKRLGSSRKGTHWDQVLFVLVVYRLLAPGSEWRLHREWFRRSALADLLGEDAGVAEIHKLYRCHDRLLEHKQAVFDHLTARWRDLFNISYDVLLYDLTSTYFEADPPFPEGDKRRFGYSRDHRPDCVQIIIALVVTPEGLPLTYEVLPGNTADKTTLRGLLERIERQYGKARRVWLMDRGVPTEEVLAEMRAADPPVHYLVGTPKGRLTPGGDRGRRRQLNLQLSARSQQTPADTIAKAGICCAPILSRKTPPSCGAIICCWWRSRRRSRTSKACPCEGRGRPRGPAGLSPARGAHRGARLHRLPGLLSARHSGAAPACAGARTDAAQCAGEVR